MTIIKIPVRTVFDGLGSPIGLAEFQNGEVIPISVGGTSANTVAQARINLEVDSSNIRNLFSASGAGSYDNATGVFTITGGVTSVAGATGAVSNVQILSGIQNTGYLTTANVVEVTNLYFTNTRADARVAPAFNQANTATTIAQAAFDSSNTKAVPADLTTANVVELTNLYFTNARAFANLVNASTTSLQEGTNLYFTNVRAREAISEGLGITYDSSNGIITANVTSVAGKTGAVILTNLDVSGLTTANVLELNNLYFTTDRADARVAPAFNQANTATTIAEAAFNSANTKTIAADLTTANVTELTNLYFTNVRAFANLVSASTTSLQEGTNLYFTNARAVAALSGQAVSMGEATITGNLFVLGNVVEFNTETLTVEDKNIVLANGAASAAVANGAGITIDGANATLTYISADDKWEFNKNLSVTGDIAATGNITSPFFYSESDIALKENVNPITNALKKVLKLTGVNFVWKKTNQKGLGVIAQDVEKIIPHIVGTSKSGYKTVQYDSLIPLLVEAIKEQQKQIEDLRKKIK